MSISLPTSVSTTAASPAISARRHAGLGVTFCQVEKRYGPVRALRGLSLDVAPGEFVALLGPNGSGKSTLLRIAALLARPTSGTVVHTDGGSALSGSAILQRIGVVSHATLLYDDLTAQENLQLFAALYGLPGAAQQIEERLRSAALFSRRSELVRGYSRGMRQRLALARALLHGPDLLLLDEPATGLDRDSLARLRDELGRLHAAGCTILLSTHQWDEAQGLATRAVELAAGCLAREFDPRREPLDSAPSAPPSGEGK